MGHTGDGSAIAGQSAASEGATIEQHSKLRAWLEIPAPGTGESVRVELGSKPMTIGRSEAQIKIADAQCSEIHAMISCEQGKYILRDMSSDAGTFINGRGVVEAELTNYDRIRVGSTTLVFRAAYRNQFSDVTLANPSNDATSPAPGRHPRGLILPVREMLFPTEMLFHPIRFWHKALETSVLNIGKALPFHALNILFLAATAYAISMGSFIVQLGVLLLAATMALGLSAVTCSVFFAFSSLSEAPHRLSQSLRFTFYVAPVLFAIQGLFLAWSSAVTTSPGFYYLAALVPTALFCAFVAFQSQYAFATTFKRGLTFAVTASVPWNLFMTGLMGFLV